MALMWRIAAEQERGVAVITLATGMPKRQGPELSRQREGV